MPPLIGSVVTDLKVQDSSPHSIVNHLRADKIMVGASTALIWLDRLGGFGRIR